MMGHDTMLDGLIDDFRRAPASCSARAGTPCPPFRIADRTRDRDLLLEARRDAQALITADPGLSQPPHARLRRMALRRYGTALDLGHVG